MTTGIVTVSELLSSKQPLKLLEKLSFEQGMALLEELVGSVESGKLSLDSAVTTYERGTQLLELLRSHLTKAEATLKRIDEKGREELAG
jgi:exodeoxyribonuclease VII small subunit